MMPAANKGPGMNIGFPDVCNTVVGSSTVPIPYPNFGANGQAMPFCVLTKICMIAALNMQAKITMTSGMEAGTAHATIKGPGTYTTGNPTILIEKAPAVHLLCPTTGNNMNNALGAVLVPSVVNVLFSHLDAAGIGHAGQAAGASVPAALARLDEALRDDVCRRELHPSVPAAGVLRPGPFSQASATQIGNAVARLTSKGATSLLLDLRGNPGGDVRGALRVADDFLPRGVVLALQRDRQGTLVHRSRRPQSCRLPLTVLVDAATGSAAEVLAGILQHHGRALLAGQKTHGTWTGQMLQPSGEAGAARYETVAGFLLPDGHDPHGTGLTPDREIDEPDPDRQLLLAARFAAAPARSPDSD